MRHQTILEKKLLNPKSSCDFLNSRWPVSIPQSVPRGGWLAICHDRALVCASKYWIRVSWSMAAGPWLRASDSQSWVCGQESSFPFPHVWPIISDTKSWANGIWPKPLRVGLWCRTFGRNLGVGIYELQPWGDFSGKNLWGELFGAKSWADFLGHKSVAKTHGHPSSERHLRGESLDLGTRGKIFGKNLRSQPLVEIFDRNLWGKSLG